MDDYCDIQNLAWNTDPRYLYEDNDPERQKSVNINIEVYKDYIELLMYYNLYFNMRRFEG